METSAGQGEPGTGKTVKGRIRKIPSGSMIRLICTPNTGHPVLGVFLCDTVMNTRRCASNYIDKENGSRHQKE